MRSAEHLLRLTSLASVCLCLSCLTHLDTGSVSHAPLPPILRTYECRPATGAVVIDGRLDEPAWTAAKPTETFVDIEGETESRPLHQTWAKMVWDEKYLYIGAYLHDPHVWATLVEHDSVIYRDNDFEVFIDPDRNTRMYYEIEINALGTIFDLLLQQTYRDGGPARHDWQLNGLRTAVHVDGSLNDPTDTDRGWSVELALPWQSLAEHAGTPCPPRDGDTWWINFSRVHWRHTIRDGLYHKIPDTPEYNWVWSPQGVINMHIPDRWGRVTFRE